MSDTALAVRSGGELATVQQSQDALMPAIQIDQMIARHNAIVQVTKQLMRKGLDYGVIPGTGGKDNDDGTPSNANNTLLKPGAEKLCTLFGLTAEYEDYRTVEDWEKGFFNFGFRCRLKRGDRVVGTGIGSANSREKKYRRSGKVCPACGKPTIIKGKEQYGGGWICFARKGGCGAKFADNDPAIAASAEGSNPDDACDLVNTLQKMGQKRAFVAAVLQATNASEFFTQDVEDMEVIEGEWTPAPAPTVTRTDEPEPDPLMDDGHFVKEAKAAAMDRGITPGEFEVGFAETLKKMNKALPELNLSARGAILAGIRSGKSDRWKTAVAQAAPAPATAQAKQTEAKTASPSPAEQTLEEKLALLSGPDLEKELFEVAKSACNVMRGVFHPGMARYVKNLLGDAHTSVGDLNPKHRVELIEALANNAVDFDKGCLREPVAA